MTAKWAHGRNWHRSFWLLCAFLLFVPQLQAQVIDEQTPQDSILIGVGEDSLDFVAQSFFSDLWQAKAIGVWLRADSGTAEVKLALVGDSGGEPDLNQVYYESSLIAPSDTGAWVIDSSFVNFIVPGGKFWVVVDGHNNLVTEGYAGVGTSNQFTDSNDPAYISADGGLTWTPQTGVPLAVYVAGDTCSFPLQISPSVPRYCPEAPVTIGVEDGYSSYAWSTGETSSTISVDSAATYQVYVLDEEFCVGFGSVNVTPELIQPVELDTGYASCSGSPVTLTVNPFYASYLWNNGEQTSTIFAYQPGFYTVEAISANGCISRDSTIVREFEVAPVTLGTDTTLCMGEFVQYDAGGGFLSYTWSSGAASRSVFIDQNAQVFVEVLDSNGCLINSDTVEVMVFPIPDTPAVSEELGNLVSTFASAYQWYLNGLPINGETSQTLQNPQAGTYLVEVTNPFGCKAVSDSLVLVTEPIGNFISEGFSPNGDGLNEVFFVEGIALYPGNSLLVFNRWGDEVFAKKPYNNDWDGSGNRGDKLPDGNYFYIFDFGNGDSPVKGTVLINR